MTDRRTFLVGAGSVAAANLAASADESFYRIAKGRLKQSACHWNFNRGEPVSVKELAEACVKMGVGSVELVGPEHWPMLKEMGLTCAIAGSHGFAKGFAHVEEHDECVAKLRQSIDACVAHGVERVITFSGFRRGLTDEVAMKSMLDGLKKILPYAEEKKIDLCLEMLNSRDPEEMKGHPDYWCDHIELAYQICKQLGSPRMKILFDIYHVQIMDGDVIRRYQQCAEFVGHIHTAGNPGRHELDDLQEIHYPGLMNAIAASGYKYWVGQEFIPRNPAKANKLKALSDAVKLCDV